VIRVRIGDFADVALEGRFSLVYVVFNTFFALLTHEDQLRCFRNVAARPTDEGVFVIEAFVPDLTRFRNDQHVSALRIDVDEVVIDASRHDPLTQRVSASTRSNSATLGRPSST
jgi:hypothetical protein